MKKGKGVRMERLRALCLTLTVFFFACSSQISYPNPPRTAQEVVIEVNSLAHEVPKFFTYRYRGKKINFFVVRIEGRVLSFFDACITCYRAKRGYRFQEGVIVCRDCNVSYSVYQIEHGLGGCFPIRVQGHLKEGKYFIPVSALESMADKF